MYPDPARPDNTFTLVSELNIVRQAHASFGGIFLGGKWKGLILWALRSEAHRFGELRRLVQGISEKMLIQHLKEMEADGIVKRRDFKEVPPRVEYALTPFGQSLYAALEPLCEWGTLHMKRIEARKEATEANSRQKALA